MKRLSTCILALLIGILGTAGLGGILAAVGLYRMVGRNRAFTVSASSNN